MRFSPQSPDLHARCIPFFARSTLLALLLAVPPFGPRPLLAENPTPKTSYKLFFGPGKAPDGYTSVPPTAAYATDPGYGFEPGNQPTAIDRAGPDALHSGFVTSDKPFFFSVAEPEGNYRVTVTLGDQTQESTTTVKAEIRRLMLEQIHTTPGQFVTRSFIVNVRTPQISTGGQVHLKSPRETTAEAWAWDDKLTLEFSGQRPCLCALQIEKVDVPTVYLLGDSTVCDQSGEPYCSWGQMLTRFFKPEIAIANHAESGETVASSTGAHRLDKVLSLLKPGEYVFIQYGHNDSHTTPRTAPETYKASLKSWVAKIKAKGGIPVLVAPMNRHTFDGPTVTNSLKAYTDMVHEAAQEDNVALIDLNAMSMKLYEFFGPEGSKQVFEHNADLSKFDATHHSPYGAYELAKCVVVGIQQAKLPLAQYISDDFTGFDPAKPDPVAQFDVPPTPGHPSPRPLGN